MNDKMHKYSECFWSTTFAFVVVRFVCGIPARGKQREDLIIIPSTYAFCHSFKIHNNI